MCVRLALEKTLQADCLCLKKPYEHPGCFTSGVAHSGQEQKGDAGWSAEHILVLSYRHHLITDDGASAPGAAMVGL